ncbi:MAG TPA: tetratricopeptide repeat protein [Stenomitos sp.]
MPPSDRDSPNSREQVLMRVGLRSGIVLSGRRAPLATPLPAVQRFGATVLEATETGWLLAFADSERPAHEQAGRLAAELLAAVPPVAVALHAPCVQPPDQTRDVLAAVEAIARPGEALATEAFWRLAKDHYVFEPLSEGVYRLGAPRVALRDVLVDRQAELSHLRSCWETASLGRPLVVSLQGEPGIGKSRLLSEFLAQARAGGQVLRACSRDNEQHRPYTLLSALVSGIGLTLGSLELEMGPEGRDLDYLLGEGSEGAAVQPRHRQFRAFRALNALLRQRFGSTPTVFALEDMQWADEASLAWLDSLLAELAFGEAIPPWLFMLTERGSELYRRYAGLGVGTVAIALGPLGEVQARELVDAVAPQLDDALRASVVDRAGGNPLFLREFARLASEEGQTEAMPSSLRWELRRRLESRIPLERQLIERAAILGPTFDLGLLSRLVEAPAVRQLLLNLAGAGLMVLGGTSGAFAHHLIYEAAYEAIPMPRRRELHSLVAHLLETENGGPTERAYHLLRGPRPAQARPHLLKAATEARRRHALHDAEALLREASRAGSEADALAHTIRLELAEVLLTSGKLEAARHELLAVRPLVPDTLRLRLALLSGQLDERRGDYGSAIAALHEGQGAVEAAAPEEKARLILAEATLLLRRGEFAACRALARRALDLLRAEASLDRALAHSLEGIATYRLDGPEHALVPYREALDLRERLGDPAGVAGSQSNLGIAYYELGRWDEAHEAFARALETFRSIGERWQSTVVLNNMGHLLLNRGSLEEAERCYREALAIKREMGEEPGVAIALGNLGNALSHRGAHPEARACLREAVLLMERLGDQETLAEAYQVFGLVELAAGDRERARALLQLALDKSHAVHRQMPRAIALRGLSQLAAQEERWGEARELAWESVQLNDRVQNPLELGRSLVALGVAYQALGDAERAMDAMDKASVLFKQLGALPDMRAVVALLD